MPASRDPQQRSPVKLTQAQRRVLAEVAPEFAGRLKLGERNQRTVYFTRGELSAIQEKARTAVRQATTGMRRNSFRHLLDAATHALDRSQGIGAIPAGERVYQFRVTLKDTDPPVWRRIQVKDCTLDKLHERIQTAMGWTNSHLHHFRINGRLYGDPLLMQENFEEFGYTDSTTTRMSEVVPKDGQRFRFEYEYDFGDSWHHEVLFEGCLRAGPGQRYPVCVEGARACPPEDVGGTWGYCEFLEAIADPEDDRHDELLGWSGPFDPEAFDPAAATRRMRRGLPNWREMAGPG